MCHLQVNKYCLRVVDGSVTGLKFPEGYTAELCEKNVPHRFQLLQSIDISGAEVLSVELRHPRYFSSFFVLTGFVISSRSMRLKTLKNLQRDTHRYRIWIRSLRAASSYGPFAVRSDRLALRAMRHVKG